MGHAIPKQHPAVVLRSHFNLVRALLGIAMVALVGLVIALVIVANDDDEPAGPSAVQAVPVTPQVAPAPLPAYPTPAPEAVSPGSDRSYSGAAPTRKLDGSTDLAPTAPVTPGTRYDGGPEEGTRGAIASPPAPGTRYDGGPEEGTRGAIASPPVPGTRYDGGPEEGTRGGITSPVAPGTRYDGGPDEGTRSPLTSQVAPGSGGADESRSGPGFRTD
jgi:hypothetical protein